MRKTDSTRVVIHGAVSVPSDLLTHYILRQIDDLRAETGDHEACRVEVDSLRDDRGALYLVSLELGSGLDPTLVQEFSLDAFLAVRNAFAVAKTCAAEHAAAATPDW